MGKTKKLYYEEMEEKIKKYSWMDVCENINDLDLEFCKNWILEDFLTKSIKNLDSYNIHTVINQQLTGFIILFNIKLNKNQVNKNDWEDYYEDLKHTLYFYTDKRKVKKLCY